LRQDLIATQLSNEMINEMGITFAYRIQMETGVGVDEIVRAYTVASNVFSASELKSIIQSMDFKVPMSAQYEMLYHMRSLVNLATRWFLYSNHINDDLSSLIKQFSTHVKQLEGLVPEIMSGETKKYLQTITEEFARYGLPVNIAKRVATYRAIYTTLNIIEVATKHHFDLTKTAKVYFMAGERASLLWFRDQIARDARDGHWNVLARLTLRDELDLAQRELTIAIMKQDQKEKNIENLINKWMSKNEAALLRWDRLLSMVHESQSVDYTMFFITVRELFALIQASEKTA
jgi:glutamate dehydrogenase